MECCDLLECEDPLSEKEPITASTIITPRPIRTYIHHAQLVLSAVLVKTCSSGIVVNLTHQEVSLEETAVAIDSDGLDEKIADQIQTGQ